MTTEKSVSLVLGSGGARGYAHIGVIKAIEERGLAIHNIAGCSMGSVVGGIYAAGKLETYREWAERLRRSDVVKLLDFSFSRTSIFKGERVFEVLKELIGECDIEDLDRGFTAVATDIDEQREIWLSEGPLFQAIRASTAVPGVFSPVEIAGRLLVDGGLVNPIPIAPTLRDTTDLTIAVNLNSMADTYHETEEAVAESDEDDEDPEGYRAKIRDFVGNLFQNDSGDDAVPDAAVLLTRSIDVMQGAIARLKLAAYAPNKIIGIPRDACGFLDFHRAAEMADLGYNSTCEVLDELDI
jgi:NTE family protein